MNASTMRKEKFLQATIDIDTLGFDAGAHLLVKHALLDLPAGATLAVMGAGSSWESTSRTSTSNPATGRPTAFSKGRSLAESL